MPLRAGASVVAGTLLAEVSGRPLIAVHGRFAAYRDLTEGDTGTDVRQLQRAVRDVLGWPSVTGRFDVSTTRAVTALYRRLGYAPIYRPSPSAPTDGTPGSTTSTPGGATAPAGKAAGPVARQVVVPVGEFVFLPAGSARVLSVARPLGAEASGTLATLAFGGFQIVAPVSDRDAASLATLPATATSRLVLGGTTRRLTFSKLGSPPASSAGPAQPAGGDAQPGGTGTSASASAVFELDGSSTGVGAGTAGDVIVDVRRSPPDSLVVPISALFSDSSGGTSVTVDPAGRSLVVPVDVVMTSEGRVAVRASDDQLRQGDDVLIGYQSAASTPAQ